MRKKLYAAYGSNLNIGQMSMRCPDAAIYKRATLKDHELLFRGAAHGAVATVEPCAGSSVPIMLWTISERDEAALDRYEGYPFFYDKRQMSFIVDSEEIGAMVYIMTPGHSAGLPTLSYYNTIIQGYKDCGLERAVLAKAHERSKQLMMQEQQMYM